MAVPLRVLLLEDHYADAELIVHELKRAGYQLDWKRIETEKEYRESLVEELDLIIADYHLPQFDAMLALEILKESGLDIPFVVVTGSISEEAAVETMRQGASDYLLKDRLARLGQAISNTLEKKSERDGRKKAQAELLLSEERFRRMAENAKDIIFRLRWLPDAKFEYVSPSVKAITGYAAEEFYENPLLIRDIIIPGDRHATQKQKLLQRLISDPIWRLRRKDGRVIWVEQQSTEIKDASGSIIALDGIARDVTDRMLHQRDLETIVAVSAALRNAADRSSLIETILFQIQSLLEVESGALVFKDPINEDDYFVEMVFGAIEPLLGRHIKKGEGLFGYVIKTGNIYNSQNIHTDAVLDIKELPENSSAVACTPLISQQEITGALLIARQARFEENEIRLLSAIADIAANAIQRTTLHEKTVRYAHQMETVSKVGGVLAMTLDQEEIFKHLVDQLMQLLPDISTIFISLFDEQKKRFNCIYASVDNEVLNAKELPPAPLEPPGVGTQSEVVHTHKPLIINNLRARLAQVKMLVQVGNEGPSTQSGLYAPMLARDRVIGVIQVQSYTVNRFSIEDAEALCLIANTAAVAIENSRLLADLRQSNLDLVQAYDSTLKGWSRALDLKDKETEGHTERVADLSVKLARVLDINGDELDNIRRGALLHDIGKMGIPDNILLKPGPLDENEWEIMRRHPGYAYELIHPIAHLNKVLDIPYCHHEKWDGTGYPRGLKNDQIPLSARIFAVIDVWDALRSDRPYRPAKSKEEALEYITSQSGKHFDPAVVTAFIHLLETELKE